MQIHFTSLNRPRATAKALKAELSLLGIETKLAAAQEAAAAMYGYRNWFELTRSLVSTDPSPDDDFCDDRTVEERRRTQVAVLRSLGLDGETSDALADRLHATNFVPIPKIEWRQEGGRHHAVVDKTHFLIVHDRDLRASESDPLEMPFRRGQGGYSLRESYGGPVGDGVHIGGARSGSTVEALKAEVAADFVRAASRKRKESAMGRRTVPEAFLSRYAVDGEVPRKVQIICDGIVDIYLEDDSHYRVSAEVHDSLHPAARIGLHEDGYAWYNYERFQAVVLAWPAPFTRDERESAARMFDGITRWKGIRSLIERGGEATESELASARRGFSTMRTDWGIVEHDAPEDGQGNVLVKAALSSVSCVPADYEPCADGIPVQTFRVPKAVYEQHMKRHYSFDPDVEELDLELYPVAEVHPPLPLGVPDEDDLDGFGRTKLRLIETARDGATEALGREGLDRLVDDAVNDLSALRRSVTPEAIREYVALQVRINVGIGEYLEPTESDLADALDEGRLERVCAVAPGEDGPRP